MATGLLAVILKKRWSSKILLPLLELLSTSLSFIIAVQLREAFHKRSSPPPRAGVITPRHRDARRGSAPYHAIP